MGDTLPALEVLEGTEGGKVNVKELFAGKKGVLFGVPGAFTPSCSKVCVCALLEPLGTASFLQTHLPGYVADWEKLKAKGVEVVACLTVNDSYVTAAWGEQQGADGKVKMLADHNAAYTKVQTEYTLLYVVSE